MTNQCSGESTPPRKVSIAESVRTVQTRMDAVDGEHAANLEGLQSARQVKIATLTREQARLERTHGADDPRVTALTQKIELNYALSAQIQRAAERAAAPEPQAGENEWIVHGHVRTRDLKAVPEVTVALYTSDGVWLQQFGHDCTDANGHFKLCVEAGKGRVVPVESTEDAPQTEPAQTVPAQNGPAPVPAQETTPASRAGGAKLDESAAKDEKPPESASGAENTLMSADAEPKDGPDRGSEGRGIHLRVTDSEQMLLGVDHVTLMPQPGRVDYREIILCDKVCTPPGDGRRGAVPKDEATLRPQARYLGNSQNREVHDLQNTKRNCRISQIAADHRVSFQTVEEAIKAKYDYCAYCFGKAKSKR